MENFEEIFSKRFLKFVQFTIKPKKKKKNPKFLIIIIIILGFSLSLWDHCKGLSNPVKQLSTI